MSLDDRRPGVSCATRFSWGGGAPSRSIATAVAALGASLALVAVGLVGAVVIAPAASAAAGCTTTTPLSGVAVTCSTAGTDTITVPSGVNTIDLVITGGGGSGASNAQNPSSTGGGNGAVVTAQLELPAGTDTLRVVVGAGGAYPGNGSSSAGRGGGGGGGSAVFAYDASNVLLAVLAVAGGGGGSGSNGAAPQSGSSRGGDGGLLGASGGSGGGMSWGGASGQGGTGASAGTPGQGGSGSGPNGSATGANGSASAAGSIAAGGLGASLTYGSLIRFGGTGGGGHSSGGGGGVGNDGNTFFGGAGGGGSSYVDSSLAISSSSAVATSGAGVGGASVAPLANPASSPGADGVVQFTLSFSAPPAPPAPAGGGSGSVPATITISFSSNGGSGSVPALAGQATTWVTAPSGAALSRPGYVFTGWNTAPDGSGLSVAVGSAIELTGDNTLFAQWAGEGDSTTGGCVGAGVTGPLGPTTGDGVIPSGGLPESDAVLLVNGNVAPVTVVPNDATPANATGLDVSAAGFTMKFAGRGDADDPLGLTEKQALVLQSEPVASRRSLVARAMAAVRARVQPVAASSGNGFKPNSEIRFFLLANTYLGSLLTDAAGNYNGHVPVPAGIVPGVYSLQATGFAPNCEVRALSLGVVVKEAATASATRTASAQVFFAPMSAQMSTEAKSRLDALVKRTGKNGVKSVVVGFVQPVGTSANDQSLSNARASTVAAYLRGEGLRGAFVVRGDGRAKQTGAEARRVEVTITFRK